LRKKNISIIAERITRTKEKKIAALKINATDILVGV